MRRLVFASVTALALLPVRDSAAEYDLADYRYFRALSIDLLGRPPSDEELAAYEAPGFSLDHWIDEHLHGPRYAERLRRVYMDALRLRLGPSFHFQPPQVAIARQTILGPDGNKLYVYFRHGQRRRDPVTDGDFCLTRDETGVEFRLSNQAPLGTLHPISKAALDAKTVVAKPWWLYLDYRAKSPTQLYSPDWSKRFPSYQLMPNLVKEADGKTLTTEVRVCKEEAQTLDTGTVVATGLTKFKAGDPLPAGRTSRPPVDPPFARTMKGKPISCSTGSAFLDSPDCGCGVGLERCIPNANGFIMPIEDPLGPDEPFVVEHEGPSEWEKLWWGEEAVRFFDRIFDEDRDFRETLTARWTEVNGPLAQFYHALAPSTCCGPGAESGYLQPDQLVDPTHVPQTIAPVDTSTWQTIADRGPHAAGVMTMPIFLVKYGSRRARAHVLYNAFLCHDFVASKVKLLPSTEPDLTKRPGCSACHTTLEPMAAYFTRISESDWTWLPDSLFPTKGCSDSKSRTCQRVYDPAFDMLRGAYGSPPHAESGPQGLAQDLVKNPDFAPCVVQNIAQSLLGRPLSDGDDAWKAQLVQQFVAGGYHTRALVRAIVTSPAYRAVSNTKRGAP